MELKNVEHIWNKKPKTVSQVSPYKNRRKNKRSGKNRRGDHNAIVIITLESFINSGMQIYAFSETQTPNSPIP